MGRKSLLSGLISKLVLQSVIDEAEAKRIIAASHQSGLSPIEQFINDHPDKSSEVIRVAYAAFHLPVFDLASFDIGHIPKEINFKKITEKHLAMPLAKRGNILTLAVADPSDQSMLDDIKFQTNFTCEAILADGLTLQNTIKAVAYQDTSLDLSDINVGGMTDAHASDSHANIDDSPVVQLINKILINAIEKGASDIHFEPYENYFRVRIRRDGVLTELTQAPTTFAPRLVARLKILSQLDISERRIPQDGRFKSDLIEGRPIDFRVSICPTLFGEKVVIRILDPTSAQLGIDALGYEPIQKQRFLDAIHKPQGMVLVTGPTGSGKTVSLYTALNILNTPEINISTAEDPVEINLPGINQVNVISKIGLTFAAALKSFLRQDPDVVMVGEIRDLETAETAVKAAQTGHLVLSTLHTNSAPETVVRLINMGIPVYNLATALSLIIAQRLARRLCKDCKKVAVIPKEALIELGFKEEEIPTLTIYEAQGCTNCQAGYKGRVGLYEVMPITPAISAIIMQGGNALDIAEQASKDGISNLHESGMDKIRMGMTTIEEIMRVTKE